MLDSKTPSHYTVINTNVHLAYQGGGMHGGVGVRVRGDESFERAMKRFQKTVEKSGVMKELKLHQEFSSPGRRRHIAEITRIARERRDRKRGHKRRKRSKIKW